MTWAYPPYSTGDDEISMVATTATDNSGTEIQYKFDRVYPDYYGGWPWGPNTVHIDTGLVTNQKYGYRVKARDTSVSYNETDWSFIGYAITSDVNGTGQGDFTPPTGLVWAPEPHATSPNSVEMGASAFDPSGVQYYFEDFDSPATNSGWQDSQTWQVTDLAPDTTYWYRVKARDKSINNNETGWSILADANTPVIDDTEPPTPNPMTWLTEPYAISPTSVSMVATTATDVSGVEYYFECTSHSQYSSNWQDSPIYTVTVAEGALYTFVVRARDKSPNQNTTADSAEIIIDLNSPVPLDSNGIWWEVEPYETGSGFNAFANMMAAEFIDLEGNDPVEYYFECVDDSQYSSGWILEREWIVHVGLQNQGLEFRFKVRDSLENESAWSSTLPSYPLPW
jgi:hypothetical protein